MKLKLIVGTFIIIFVVIVLYFWAVGIWFPGQPPKPAVQKAELYKAAKSGLFDPPSPPIVHKI